jgi:NAD(P)H-flavin reductase
MDAGGQEMNQYIPLQAEIVDIDIESPNTYLISLALLEEGAQFHYKPGQFVMVSVFGLGECPISISSTPPAHIPALHQEGRQNHERNHGLKGETSWHKGPVATASPEEMKRT